MIALILNSGLGRRMGSLTNNAPKCMTKITSEETILSRQLKQIAAIGIKNTVITTGAFDTDIKNYCNAAKLPMTYSFAYNPVYAETNYIYSIYLAKELLNDDILLMHGDLVFDDSILELVVNSCESCMTVSSEIPLPEKDFKAVVDDDKIIKVGIEFFENAVAAQPLYKFLHEDFKIWLKQIIHFCENGKTNCYAENALNEVTNLINLRLLDIKNKFCAEIDTLQDLEFVKSILGGNS